MESGQWILHFLLISQVLLPLVVGDTIDPMSPVAVTEGEPFNLTCIVTYTSQLEGIRLEKDLPRGLEKGIYKLFPPDYNDDPDVDTTKYSVTRIGKSSFTITTKAAVFDDAGTYACVLMGNRDIKQIAVVVVVRPPKLQLKKLLPAGEDTPVTCDVEYDVPNDLTEEEKADRVPKLSARIGDVEQTGTITTAFKRVSMTWNMTVSENDDQKELICRAYTAVPDYSIERSAIMNVVYGTKTVTLSPLNEEYTVGDRVNCTADGNPAPTIKWQVIESNTIGGNVGTALLITNAMVGFTEKWKCSAYNMIAGKPSPTQEKAITFSVVAPTEPPTGERKESPTAAIVAGVTVPVVIIIGVIIAIIIILLRRKSKTPKGPPPPSQDIEDSQPAYQDDPLPPKDIPPPTNNTPQDGGQSGKPIPAQRSVKPNTHGHNVGFPGEKPDPYASEDDVDLQADVARRAMTPMPGDDRGYSPPPYSVGQPRLGPPAGGYRLPTSEAMRQAPAREKTLRRVEPPTEYPDMVAAHPGLQQAYNKPKPADRYAPDTAV